jgi:hypothetical protein
MYGKGFDTGPLRSGQGPRVSVGFGVFWSFFLGFRPGFLYTFPALFQGRCSCGGVSSDRNLPVAKIVF